MRRGSGRPRWKFTKRDPALKVGRAGPVTPSPRRDVWAERGSAGIKAMNSSVRPTLNRTSHFAVHRDGHQTLGLYTLELSKEDDQRGGLGASTTIISKSFLPDLVRSGINSQVPPPVRRGNDRLRSLNNEGLCPWIQNTKLVLQCNIIRCLAHRLRQGQAAVRLVG